MALFDLEFSNDNISLGPCYVYWKGPLDLTFRHVGHTFGGVSVSITQSAYELKSDLYGDTPVRVMDGGIRLEATVNMTETTFENLKMLFSSATDETTYLTFGKPVGGVLNTGELILEPTDGSEVFHIYSAAANIGEAVEISYTTENQRVLACKFVALMDDSREEGDQLFRIGGWDSS
jgi:hypothetical protein